MVTRNKIILFIFVVFVITFFFWFLGGPKMSDQGALSEAEKSSLDIFFSEIGAVKVDAKKIKSLFEVPTGGVEALGLPYSYTKIANAETVSGVKIRSEDLNNIDIKVIGDIPDDFKNYVANSIALGVAHWDKLYPDKDFSFGDYIKNDHIKVLITTDREPFQNLASSGQVQDFRHGFVKPCPRNSTDNCPEIMIYFEPAQWDGTDYSPMVQNRIAHEVFHVGHFLLLKSIGKAQLFQTPGYYWQTEGFATFSQRLLPDKDAYSSFGSEILKSSYFSWPSKTNKSYEKSYEVSPFIDEIVYLTGDKPNILINWLKDVKIDETSSFSLMNLLVGVDEDAIDVSKFQNIYLRAIVDLYFPGLNYRELNPRTVGVINPGYSKLGVFDPTKDSKNFRLDVPLLGNSLGSINLKLPSENFDKELKIELSPSKSKSLRAIVLAIRSKSDDNELYFCYGDASRQDDDGSIKSEARKCFNNNVKVLGSVAPGSESEIKINIKDLQNWKSGFQDLKIVFLLTNTIEDVSNIDTKPIQVGINLKTEEVGSTFGYGRFFPTILGDSDYSGGFGSNSICYMQSYPSDEKRPNYLTNVSVNIDLESQIVTGTGSVDWPNGGKCKITLKGEIDKDKKRIDAKISGSSVYSLIDPDQREIFGSGFINAAFEGEVELANFREDKRVDSKTGLTTTSWNWNGEYNITYIDSGVDKSKLKGSSFSKPPKPGQKEKGSFYLNVIVK